MGEGKLDEARAHITDMLKMARDDQDDYHEMEGLYLYANYYKARKNIDSAISCYKTIYHMAMANNYGYWKVEILELLLDAYNQTHNVSQQLATNKLLIKALKQNNDNNSSFIGDYVQYNKTQQELNKYRTNYDATRRRSIWLIVLVFAVGIVTVVIFRLYKDSQHKAQVLARLNDTVSNQNQELQQTDEFKSKLISMLAHDFRSPLGSAISMMRLVRDDDELEKEELEVLYNSIETDMQNILLTFDNILQWVKKQMAGFTYQPERLSVNALMAEAGSMFKGCDANQRSKTDK
jgi:signal transduction histidine kinase